MTHNSLYSPQPRLNWLRTTFRILLTLVLLTLLIAPSLPVAFAQSGPQGKISDDVWAKMSTPARIDSAFERDVIDREARILYTAYAVYDQSALPEAYHSTVGWHGTRAVAEVKQAHEQRAVGKKALSSRSLAELDRILAPAAGTYCDRADGNQADTSAHFAISYSDAGANAIQSLTLANYKTSLDTSYTALVTDYGWARPPVCGDGTVTCGGTSTPDGKYPVLITNLGSGLFGYVAANPGDGSYAGNLVGNNPYTTIVEDSSVTSCMVLNSDYTATNFEGGTNTPQENLDGTTSHEYVHAIQNAWGDPGAQMAAMWAESTAAYFEDEVFDSGNSQYVYLYGDFNKNSLTDWSDGTSGQKDYENFIFFRYIAEQFGGANLSTGGAKVIKKFFENVATSTPAVDQELLSFKAAVESFGLDGGDGSSTFSDVFHDFAIAAKFMKDCQDQAGYGSKYCFKEGTEYRSAARNFQETGNIPAATGEIHYAPPRTFSGTIKNDYGIAWVRLPQAGNWTYKVTMSSSSTTNLKASVVCDKGTSFQIDPFIANVVDSTPHGWGKYNPAGCSTVYLVITNQDAGGIAAMAPESVSAPAATHNFTVNTESLGNDDPTAVKLSRVAASSGSAFPLAGLGAGLLLVVGLVAVGGRRLWSRRSI